MLQVFELDLSDFFKKLSCVLKIHTYINRIFFYLPVIYGASKLIQWSFNQSESCWQLLWNEIQKSIGGPDPFNYCVILFNAYINTFFWTIGLSLMAAEYFDVFGLKNDRKLQKNRDTLSNTPKVLKAMAFICLNQIINFTLSWISFRNGNMLGFKWTSELPSFISVMFDLFVFFWTHEILVYFSHRIMHHKSIYKYVHKMHHEFTAPVSVIAMYTHPIENFLSSTADIAAFSILKPHIMTCLLWMTITVLTGLVDHSGLDLPLLPDSKWHDYHHQTSTVNFSTYKIMDVIMDTDRKFIEEKPNQPTDEKETFKNHEIKTELYPK